MGRLDGKVALVTGGASGLGRSHALRMAEEGADVAIFDLGDDHAGTDPGYPLARQQELDAAVAEIESLGRRGLGLTGDVQSQEDLDAAVASCTGELGGIDVLVANAGVAFMAPLTSMDRADWELVLGVNLTGVWQSCKAVIPGMVERESGSLILISSAAGFKSWPGVGAYSVSKAGVIMLAKQLAMELGQSWVRVNSVCPSSVPTGQNKGLIDKHGLDYDEVMQAWKDVQIFPCNLEPRDISNAVVWLASDDARFVTGAVFPIDGGATAL